MLPENETDITTLQRHWHAHAPASELATRIVAHATTLPQQRPWKFGMAAMTQRFHAWNAAVAYQGVALAAIALVGVYTAQMAATDNIDVNALVNADTGWSEDL